MNKKVLRLLEYNKILELLSNQAGSKLAKGRIEKLLPMKNMHMISDALTETTEAVSVILYKGSIPLGDMDDLTDILDMARKGRTLTMAELLSVRRSIVIAKDVKRFLSSDMPEGIRAIVEMADLISTVSSLDTDIDRCILSEDEMADNASSELKSLRRDIRNTNESIKTKLYRITNSQASQKYLQDAIVTVRNGRYVIPVKKEYSSQIPGMVHDQSQTGATLFIEPQSIVEMNNELKQLNIAEQREIERILKAFSDRVSEHYHEIMNNQELIVKLDVINAKGKLSCLIDGVAPRVNEEGILNIRGGRHPLIDKKKVVPINVSLGDGFKTLLITGPNTGGKTVTLKTIGLFILMMETGLHVPCNDDSDIPIFDEVFADIGDEQSIEQSLSTFSSHMTNITEIIDNANDKSLVLLDELGAGTDPTEGAALGIALLEKLHALGSSVAATTHYTELKKYALSNEGVENASMEFNVETLSPTYKLRMGLPGKSNAFEISRRIGIKEPIIERAKELLDESELNFENVVSTIEKDKERAESALGEAKRLREDAENVMQKASQKLDKAMELRQSIIDDAHEEARRIIRDAEHQADDAARELRELRKESNSGDSVRVVSETKRRLKEAEKSHLTQVKKVSSEAIGIKPEAAKVGVQVKVYTIGQNGEIESIPDSKGNLTVRIGSLKMNANISDLVLVENMPPGNKEKKRKAYSKIITGKTKDVGVSIKVIGKNLDDAIAEVEKYLDDASIAGLKSVSIIHGRGEGILKEGLRDYLKHNKSVKSFKGADYNNGGEGVTVVELKE